MNIKKGDIFIYPGGRYTWICVSDSQSCVVERSKGPSYYTGTDPRGITKITLEQALVREGLKECPAWIKKYRNSLTTTINKVSLP